MKLCTKRPGEIGRRSPSPGLLMLLHNEISRQVTRRIADALAPGAIPWRKDWVAHRNSGIPCDIDGTSCRGINAILLQMAASEFGFRSRWWARLQNWRSLGFRLKWNTCAGTKIVTFDDGQMRESVVFNAEQVAGAAVDEYLVRCNGPAQVDWQRAERLVVTSGAKINFVFGTLAAYHRPPQDCITFPLKRQFEKGPGGLSGYYDSLFHELLHWTEPRLLWYPDANWDEATKYAINELRAEMGAGWLATTVDIPISKMDRNHKKYLDCWLSALREDPGLIFQVAQSASCAVEYLLHIATSTQKEGGGT
jgi:antirestriction protein ArdC